jgi:hypothetical protein
MRELRGRVDHFREAHSTVSKELEVGLQQERQCLESVMPAG